MGSFNINLRASMNIFTIFGIVKMLQINTNWKLSKMSIIKICEQMWVKTFYFATPIFVEVLKGKSSPYEFLQIL